jgi:hypothetical protein
MEELNNFQFNHKLKNEIEIKTDLGFANIYMKTEIHFSFTQKQIYML